MSLIRDALNKAQQEQDAARAGRPVPKFTPSYTRKNAGNGTAAKVFGGLIALGGIMGCVALFLQVFYPMSRLTEKPPEPARPVESAPAGNVVVKITPPKPSPHEGPAKVVSAPPVAISPAPPVAPSLPPVVAAPSVPVLPVVPVLPAVPVPTPMPAAPVVVAVVPSPPPPNTPPVVSPVAVPAPVVTPSNDPSQQLVEFVQSLAVRAVMVRPGGDRVSMLGRVFQSGDFLPGAPKPLKLDEITKDTLTFKDNAGNSYTKRL